MVNTYVSAEELGDIEIQRELYKYTGDKKMAQVAIASVQEEMKRMLEGDMGKDMDDILSGRKTIKMPKTSFIKRFFKRLITCFKKNEA